jgi:hypothetical protein
MDIMTFVTYTWRLTTAFGVNDNSCERQIESCGTVVAGTGKTDRADLDWSL